MNKDFDVKKFVEEYEKQLNDSERNHFLKSKLKVENYLPYSEKLLVAEHIVKSSSYAIVKEDEVLKKTDRIKINSPVRYILFVMEIVNKYTNIEVNFKDVMPEFDYLNKNGLIEVIIDKIGAKETGEFNTVVEMVLDDFMTNEYEIKNWISEMLSKTYSLVEKCSPHIENIINKLDDLSEEDMNKLSALFNKVTKYIKK